MQMQIQIQIQITQRNLWAAFWDVSVPREDYVSTVASQPSQPSHPSQLRFWRSANRNKIRHKKEKQIKNK